MSTVDRRTVHEIWCNDKNIVVQFLGRGEYGGVPTIYWSVTDVASSHARVVEIEAREVIASQIRPGRRQLTGSGEVQLKEPVT